MMDETRHDSLDSAPDAGGGADFEATRTARYERLSLLTLDLAEEAGEAAVNFSHVDNGPRRGRFERRIAAMTRAIWAHGVIERMRLGHGIGPRAAAPALCASENDAEAGTRERKAGRGMPAIPAMGLAMGPATENLTGDLGKALASDKTATAETDIAEPPSPEKQALGKEEAEEAGSTAPEDLFGDDFDASNFVTDDGEVDEAAIEAAVRAALNGGGDERLRAAVYADDQSLDDLAAGATRAPP